MCKTCGILGNYNYIYIYMYYIPQNSKTKFSLFHYMKLARQVFSMKG